MMSDAFIRPGFCQRQRFYRRAFFCVCLIPLFFISCTKSDKKKPLNKEKAFKEKTTGRLTFFRNLGSEPENLHPIRSTDLYASIVQNHVLDSMLVRNSDTYKWEPHLAEKWEVSKDHKLFTFTIRSDVKWHDGKPLTVKDVAFSFNAYKDPSYGGVHFLPYLENIESVAVLDDKRVQFKARKKYFGNLDVLGNLSIIPEHIYKDKEKKLSRVLVGSGPYVFKKYEKGKKIVLEQNEQWWGRSVKSDTHRIPRIVFRFIKDENDQLIRMTAGSFDFLSLSAEAYIKKTNKKPWGETIIKKEVSNKQPARYGYIGWNLKNPLFQSKKTRKALTHLMNRELMNKKFRYGKAKLASGPWYLWSDYADPSAQAIPFDPKKAGKLLSEAGWRDTDKNGVLDQIIQNQKKEFSFTLIFSNKDMEKYFTIYQQDLKKSGINMSLRFMDWSAFLKIIHEKKFSAVSLGWSGGSVDLDPKQIWHSQSSRKGGHNFISYSNPKVDQLIDKGREEMDRNKRVKIFQKVYRLIAEDCPYLFLFNSPVQFYAHSKKLKMEKDTYTYELGTKYWQVIAKP